MKCFEILILTEKSEKFQWVQSCFSNLRFVSADIESVSTVLKLQQKLFISKPHLIVIDVGDEQQVSSHIWRRLLDFYFLISRAPILWCGVKPLDVRFALEQDLRRIFWFSEVPNTQFAEENKFELYQMVLQFYAHGGAAPILYFNMQQGQVLKNDNEEPANFPWVLSGEIELGVRHVQTLEKQFFKINAEQNLDNLIRQNPLLNFIQVKAFAPSLVALLNFEQYELLVHQRLCDRTLRQDRSS